MMYLLQALFQGPENSSFLIRKIIGYIFFLTAGLLGTYFLFYTLVPLIGYKESGMGACFVLALLGGLFLLSSEKKKVTLPEEMTEKALDLMKDMDVGSLFKKNATFLSTFAFCLGIALSQFKKHLTH